MKFLQENTSFIEQVKRTVYQYSYWITGEGPKASENKFEEQRYTGWLNRTTGEGPVGSLTSRTKQRYSGEPHWTTGRLSGPTF